MWTKGLNKRTWNVDEWCRLTGNNLADAELKKEADAQENFV